MEVGPKGHYVYWLRSYHSDVNEQQVYRTSLQGGETERIIGGKDVLDIAIDERRGHLYWSTDQGIIMRGQLDGTDAEIVFDQAPHPTRIAFDEGEGALYWMTTPEPPSFYHNTILTRSGGSLGVIKKARVDTSAQLGGVRFEGQPETIANNIGPPRVQSGALLGEFALEVDTTGEAVFYGNRTADSEFYTYRVDRRGQAARIFKWGEYGFSHAGDPVTRMGFAVDSDSQMLYHATDDGRIVKLPSQGGAMETVLSEGINDPTDVDLGPDSETIFWTEISFGGSAPAGIYKANIDGTGKRIVYPDSLMRKRLSQQASTR